MMAIGTQKSNSARIDLDQPHDRCFSHTIIESAARSGQYTGLSPIPEQTEHSPHTLRSPPDEPLALSEAAVNSIAHTVPEFIMPQLDLLETDGLAIHDAVYTSDLDETEEAEEYHHHMTAAKHQKLHAALKEIDHLFVNIASQHDVRVEQVVTLWQNIHSCQSGVQNS
ncbi:hypothetical protein AcW2_005826 [Taiwanofungus camphoratus]|nr:hypothetical protein AcW2_005826 [Antrodia cinnamomea]